MYLPDFTCHNQSTRKAARLFGTLLAFVLTVSPAALHAQVVLTPATPQTGSSNPVSPEPNVPRPGTKPCTVQLFSNLEFIDFTDKTFSYTPPAGCHGPWAKVVFSADFTVTAGRQFDRTAKFFIGGSNIYFGTTAEPRATLSPSWHVERDITDLSAVLKTDQPGIASIGNFFGVSGGVDYNGEIFSSAKLEFYPASFASPAPRVPDAVFALPAAGETQALDTTADQLSETLTLPRNVEQAYLDVISQSQASDEFWYTCSPTSVATELDNCPNTGFRETEVSIDGKPAGIAPVYPWIYTGGLDPFLWEPTPGIQTLNFKPYRVDLTPFAGLLSDGAQHTVAISVFNANDEFDVTASLLLFLDHGSKQVTGAVTKNTLSAAPTPVVKNTLTTDSTGGLHDSATVTSNRSFTLAGYVNTSHGRVATTVNEVVEFTNAQVIDDTDTEFAQSIEQQSGSRTVTTTGDGPLAQVTNKSFVYPLKVDFTEQVNSDGSETQATTITQQDQTQEQQSLLGFTYFNGVTNETVNTQDTLNINASGASTGNTASSTADYSASDSLGQCYSRDLTSKDNVLTKVQDGTACRGHNRQ